MLWSLVGTILFCRAQDINIIIKTEMTTDIQNCTPNDFYQILRDVADFWGSDRALYLHHPMFLYEFGNAAYVIREDKKVVAYLFGFLCQTSTTGYIHLIGVRRSVRNKGLGTLLYNHFTNYAKQHGCNKLKAITTPANHLSILFHKKIGMTLLGENSSGSIEVMKDYAGPGQDRVVFEKLANCYF
jgi:GNAT superfamily N-acetyltransferase